VLDLVMALRRPSDYEPRDGARFELHFEKARGLFGEVTDPIEAQLVTDDAGVARWDWRPAQVGELDRAAALLRDGLNPSQVAAELGISKAKGIGCGRSWWRWGWLAGVNSRARSPSPPQSGRECAPLSEQDSTTFVLA